MSEQHHSETTKHCVSGGCSRALSATFSFQLGVSSVIHFSDCPLSKDLWPWRLSCQSPVPIHPTQQYLGGATHTQDTQLRYLCPYRVVARSNNSLTNFWKTRNNISFWKKFYCHKSIVGTKHAKLDVKPKKIDIYRNSHNTNKTMWSRQSLLLTTFIIFDLG